MDDDEVSASGNKPLAGDRPRLARAVAERQTVKGKVEQPQDLTGCKKRLEQAEARTEQAETRTEQAKTRAESAETRTEQAEATLDQVVHKEVDRHREMSAQLQKAFPANGHDQRNPLEQLTSRQREILQFIAEGQNTKQIAEILKVSPKTVEYHRMKVMAGLNLHDIPGLVRYALRVGLIPPES